jgi:hypothetical protein
MIMPVSAEQKTQSEGTAQPGQQHDQRAPLPAGSFPRGGCRCGLDHGPGSWLALQGIRELGRTGEPLGGVTSQRAHDGLLYALGDEDQGA